jgi:hypothetical protein
MRRLSPRLLALAVACGLVFLPACSRAPGVYHQEGIRGNSLTLRDDGRFLLQESGESISGTYTIHANEIVLVTEDGEKRRGQVQSGVLYDPHGNRWVKK